MSVKNIDIVQESTLQKILELVKDKSSNSSANVVESVTIGEYGQIMGLHGLAHEDYISRGYMYSCVEARGDIYFYQFDEKMIYKIRKNDRDGSFLPIPVIQAPFTTVYSMCTRLIYFDNALHLLGGSGFTDNSHLKWDLDDENKEWEVASDLPYNFCGGSAVVCNNKLHIFGGYTYPSFMSIHQFNHASWDSIRASWTNKHYYWDGNTWTKAADTPFTTWGSTPFVINNTIHLAGGGIVDNTNLGTNHYLFKDDTWKKATNLPTPLFKPSIVSNGTKAYVLGGIDPSSTLYVGSTNGISSPSYTISGIDFSSNENGVIVTLPSSAPNLPNNAMNATGQGACRIPWKPDGYLIFGKQMYTMSGSGYVNTGGYGYLKDVEGGAIVNYKNQLHFFKGTYHYSMFNGEFLKGGDYGADPNTSNTTIPFNFVNGSALVFEDKIHLIGSTVDSDAKKHYTWDSKSGWVRLKDLPFKFGKGSAVVYRGEIHLIGGTGIGSSSGYNHYKLTSNDECVPVARISGHIYWNNAAMVRNENNGDDTDFIYVAYIDKYYLGDTSISSLVISIYSPEIGWVRGFRAPLDKLYSIPTPEDAPFISIVADNHLVHVFYMDHNVNKNTMNHMVVKPCYYGHIKNIPYYIQCISCPTYGIIPTIYTKDNFVYYMVNGTGTNHGIYKLSCPIMVAESTEPSTNSPLSFVRIHLDKGQKINCLKESFIPLIDTDNNIHKSDVDVDLYLEETESGYIVLKTGDYVFARTNYGSNNTRPFSIG